MTSNNNKNIFLKMANYLYKEDDLKKAYLRGCANGICLMRNIIDTVAKVDDLLPVEDQIQDVKVLNALIHNNRILSEEDVRICKLLDKPVTACNFSPRSLNGLTRMNIRTVKDLVEKIPDGDLNSLRGFGRKCVNEVMGFLNDNNLFFGMMTDPIVMEKYAIYKWK